MWRLTLSTRSSHPALTIKVNSILATAYWDAYHRALGSRDDTKQTLNQFITGFVEDQLAQEIAFFEKEIASDR